jgi:hypothetical protein
MRASDRCIVCSLLLTTATMVTAASAAAQGTSVLMLLPTDGRTLEVGGEFTGALSTSDNLSADDHYLEAWELRGRAGQAVTVDLESDAFDARLYIVGPGLGETLSDDDGGGGCNSRITFIFLETGVFRVVASALGIRETGPYTLRVSQEPGVAPTYGCGEADPALLASLPTNGRTLAMGTVGNSQLGAGSEMIHDGRPAEAWLLEGRQGDRVSIVMESSAFDAYLYLMGPGLDGVRSDDDGAGDLDAKIDLTLPADGSYTIVATALTAGTGGPYTMRVEEPVDLNTLPTMGRTIEVGEARSGELTWADPTVIDGRRGQVWGFEGTAGQRVAVELFSDDFDAYLYLVGPGLIEPMSDDDSAGDLDARIMLTLPATGTYRIIASALGAGESGGFTLSTSAR